MATHRAARREGRVALVGAGDLDAALDALFRLHGARWEARGEAGVLADDRVQGFHRRAAPALQAAGLLRLRVLRLNDVVAGVFHGLHSGTTAAAYLGGFDPAFGFESPGTLLMGAALEGAAAEGARRFDFLRGREAYKYRWGAVDRWTIRRLLDPKR